MGSPVTATDADRGDIITYVLMDGDEAGDDAAFFKVNKMTGQITVNGKLDHERTGRW